MFHQLMTRFQFTNHMIILNWCSSSMQESKINIDNKDQLFNQINHFNKWLKFSKRWLDQHKMTIFNSKEAQSLKKQLFKNLSLQNHQLKLILQNLQPKLSLQNLQQKLRPQNNLLKLILQNLKFLRLSLQSKKLKLMKKS